MRRSVSVLIADDNSVVRRLLRDVFNSQPDFRVCGEAGNGREAITKAQELHPDLIVMDISMPGINGLDAARELQKLMPDVPILMLSVYVGRLAEQEDRFGGIWALVPKSEKTAVILRIARKLTQYSVRQRRGA